MGCWWWGIYIFWCGVIFYFYFSEFGNCLDLVIVWCVERNDCFYGWDVSYRFVGICIG